MGTKTTIKITDPKLTRWVWELYGVCAAYEVLGGDKPKSSLPGFALAHALVAAQMSDTRVHLATQTHRFAAKQGFDISKIAVVSTTIKDGEPALEIEEADLADMASDGPKE